MSGKSKIEWTDITWNPVTGYTKVSAGCDLCWARRFSRRTFGKRPFSKVRCHPERLDQPLHWRKPRKVATCLMSDLFHKDVPDDFIARVFQSMRAISRHTFQILTKRPARALELLSRVQRWEGWYTLDGDEPKGYQGSASIMGDDDNWPLHHVWLGVSVEDQKTADERIPLLLSTPAAVRFVSYEPALGPVDLERGGFSLCSPIKSPAGKQWPGLDWVIAGGESGPGARPANPDWFRSVRDQCQAASVPFLFKQWGEWFPRDQWKYKLKLVLPSDKRAYYESRRTHLFEGPHGLCPSHRVGKKRAGRLLDGREWNEFPEAR